MLSIVYQNLRLKHSFHRNIKKNDFFILNRTDLHLNWIINKESHQHFAGNILHFAWPLYLHSSSNIMAFLLDLSLCKFSDCTFKIRWSLGGCLVCYSVVTTLISNSQNIMVKNMFPHAI